MATCERSLTAGTTTTISPESACHRICKFPAKSVTGDFGGFLHGDNDDDDDANDDEDDDSNEYDGVMVTTIVPAITDR